MTEFGESAELAAELSMEALEGPASRHWHKQVAFMTLLIAVLAAAATLLAGLTAHEILIERTQEIVDIAIAEGDLERAETLRDKHDVLAALGVQPDPDEVATATQLEMSAERALAGEVEAESEAATLGSLHFVFAVAATLFAVAIAVSGLSIVVDQRWLSVAGACIAGGALIVLGVGVVGLLR